MKKTVIPAGYRISVNSWENDGDNRKTKTIEGVKKEHIPFILATCNLLKSNMFGNLYDESTEGLKEALDELVLTYPDRPKYCDSGEEIADGLLYELGLTDSSEFQTRVFDGIKIEYVPTEIVLEDVTSQFI